MRTIKLILKKQMYSSLNVTDKQENKLYEKYNSDFSISSISQNIIILSEIELNKFNMWIEDKNFDNRDCDVIVLNRKVLISF